MQSTEHLNIAPNSADAQGALDFHIVSGGQFSSHLGQPIIAPAGFWAARVLSEKGERKLYVGGIGRKNNSAIKSFVQAELNRKHESTDLNIVNNRADSRVDQALHDGYTTVRNGADADKHQQKEHKHQTTEHKKAKKHAAKIKQERLFPENANGHFGLN